jgi:hypothetical protein
LIAGTVFSSAALAQKSARPAPRQRNLQVVSEVPQPARAPDFIRSVRWENGQIVPTSEWRPYHVPGSAGSDTANEYVFDAVQDGPNVPPGTLPTTGRYTFYLEFANDSYTTAIRNFDMASIPAAAQGQGAKVCDFMIREQNGTLPLFVTILTGETFDANTAPTSPTWGMFPGIQLNWATGIGNGFWFSSADVTTQAPPVGDGWKMPTDGAGAYVFIYSRDGAGTQVAQSVQPGCWGTGNFMQPPVPKVGTQASIGQADESTPPNCNITTLAQNVPNLIVEPTCETYSWAFNPPPPAPAPTTLSPAIGFGMKLQGGVTGACCTAGSCSVTSQAACVGGGGVYQGDNTNCATTVCGSACYPNCDGSTINPCLNVQDFGCFLNKFANQDTFANCDNSTIDPVLNVQDFGCFLNKFAIGCSSC